jgi:preprotein translocase subunit SecE
MTENTLAKRKRTNQRANVFSVIRPMYSLSFGQCILCHSANVFSVIRSMYSLSFGLPLWFVLFLLANVFSVIRITPFLSSNSSCYALKGKTKGVIRMTENTLTEWQRIHWPNDKEYIDRMTENTLAEWQRIHWPNDREYIGRMTENTLAEWQRIHWPKEEGQTRADKTLQRNLQSNTNFTKKLSQIGCIYM